MIGNKSIFDYKIKNFCAVGDGAHASIERQMNGVMYLTSKNFKKDGIDLSKVDYISEADFEKYFEKNKSAIVKPSVGDVVFGIIGSIGTPYVMRQKDRFGLSSSVGIIRPNQDISPKYLYYFMTSSPFQLAVEAMKSGSAQGFLSLEMIRNLPLIKFDIKIQNKIAAILSSYDDLIENNQRRIALLEKMAEEIYREWFVRFRFPGYQSAEFEKGVPKGWKKITFGRICKFDKGKNPEEVTELPDEDMALYVNVESLSGEGKNYAKKQKNSVECQIGDILMLMDGSRSGLVFRANNCGIVGSTLSVIRMEKSLKNYIYEYLQAMREAIIFNNTGSAIPHANKEYINRMIVFIPEDESIILKFNNVYDRLYVQIDNLRQQNIQLENTKKALLPRLISGKLSVENLDIQFPPSMSEDGAA